MIITVVNKAINENANNLSAVSYLKYVTSHLFLKNNTSRVLDNCVKAYGFILYYYYYTILTYVDYIACSNNSFAKSC